jgi:hypothetical protein
MFFFQGRFSGIALDLSLLVSLFFWGGEERFEAVIMVRIS